ncbi:MAG: DUF4080 domain-containing protein [Fusobacteriaceae bacterium]
MKKYLLVALNSQYIHTNLAVRYLKKYADQYSGKKIEIYESNINNQTHNIIRDIFEKSPDVVLFSTYIWNKEQIFKISKELKKIMPDLKIGLGGPEVTYDSEDVMKDNPEVDFIIKGEGERAFLKVVQANIDELLTIYSEPMPCDLDEIPFPYSLEEIMKENKILYYESSRGCPFSCSYCLSSIDKGVKNFSLERVKKDLGIFLHSNIKLLKFVDRTFNINKGRYLEIWKFLIENYRPGIIFHFEINANIFDEETLELLKKVPKDYFQFEIGIQSVNWETMESINRRNLLERLTKNIQQIPRNIHLHLDLIAGLPFETYSLFKNSFNYVYNLKPEMIQLGFLKILKGTKISKEIIDYEYKYLDFQPYEVLSNKFINFSEICRLKNLEKLLDWYYNSEKFMNSVNYIVENNYPSPFVFFEEISDYFKTNNLLDLGHKDASLYTYLLDFYKFKKFTMEEKFIEFLKYDFLLLAKPGNYPNWLKSEKDSELYNNILKTCTFKSIREGHRYSELEKFRYNILENKDEMVYVFFDYRDKSVKKIDENDYKSEENDKENI